MRIAGCKTAVQRAAQRGFGVEGDAADCRVGLEQVLEGFSDDGFALTAADLFDEVELAEVGEDETGERDGIVATQQTGREYTGSCLHH
ncbi:MAG: hypothetical protein ACP5NM_04135 [Thiomonas sp.]